MVPLMSMLRHRRRTTPELPMRLVYSVRTPADVIYADELGEDAVLTFTREAPAGWGGHAGASTPQLIADALSASSPRASRSCAAPTASWSPAASCCSSAGFAPEQIRTERFGPSG